VERYKALPAKEQAQLLEALIENPAYAALVEIFQTNREKLLTDISISHPADIGDVLARERLLGATLWMGFIEKVRQDTILELRQRD